MGDGALTVPRVNLAELDQTIHHLAAAAAAIHRHREGDPGGLTTLELTIIAALDDLERLRATIISDQAA
jgi:hypothetical protein